MTTMEIRYPNFGERFSKLMDAKGWSTSQLASIAGPTGGAVTFATIARLRKGQTRPRPALTERLAHILEVTPEELLGDDAPASRKFGSDSPVATTSKIKPHPIERPEPEPPADKESLAWKMARIVAIQRQIADAEAAKSELAHLLEEVGSELTRLKYLTTPSP
jgi:transcriptional regulator with XRE-family HTH domain